MAKMSFFLVFYQNPLLQLPLSPATPPSPPTTNLLCCLPSSSSQLPSRLTLLRSPSSSTALGSTIHCSDAVRTVPRISWITESCWSELEPRRRTTGWSRTPGVRSGDLLDTSRWSVTRIPSVEWPLMLLTLSCNFTVGAI